MNKEQIIASANQAQQNEDNQTGVCSRTWHIGFFFDGVGRNIELDAPQHRLSNVARLYRAFPDRDKNTPEDSYDVFYYSGLGTPFNDELSTKLHAAMDGSLDKLKDEAIGIPKDAAEDAGKELLSSSWYEILDKQWKKLLNPTEWGKIASDATRKIAIKVGIEATPWLRDSKLMSEIFVTGVDTRLAAARQDFEVTYKKNSELSPLPIKSISISVFGFDLGATLARKFIDDLLNDICQKEQQKDSSAKYTYETIPVNIIFAGFFDCSRHTPASSNNGMDYFAALAGVTGKTISPFLGEKAIDQDTPLPSAIRNALHLVAAHERRPWRGIYALGKQGKWPELLLPGSSEDIGGGLLPDEQKPSAELCRVALHQMYRCAYMAGVPFPDYQTLPKLSETIASYFLMNDAIEGYSAQNWATRYRKNVGNQPLSVKSQNAHLDSYFDWLGQQYYLYCTELERLDTERKSILTTTIVPGIIPEDRKKMDEYTLAMQTLKNNWGWLDDVKDQALWFINSVMTNPNEKRTSIAPDIYIPTLRRAEQFMEYSHCAYQKKPMPVSNDKAPAQIFAWLAHDIQKVDPAASISVDFLTIRSVEIPDDEEE